MTEPAILIIRLSAMGDVAMSLPVIRSIVSDTRLVILTRPLFAEFFTNIDNLTVISADTAGAHKGLAGIFRLTREIRKEYNIRQVIDLHDVIRSRIISFLFRIRGSRISRINKGRKEKRELLKNSAAIKLTHSADRYLKVFIDAGLRSSGLKVPAFSFTNAEIEGAADFLLKNESGSAINRIAFAPLARHATKEWPTANARKFIRLLTSELNAIVFLFGGRDDREKLDELAESYPSVVVVAGQLPFRKELALLTKMSLMVSMDSSNMHLAAVAGLSTVSVWGGTHHFAGFGPIGDQQHILVDISPADLNCRPCTIYGRGECLRSDLKYKCLADISPERVISDIREAQII